MVPLTSTNEVKVSRFMETTVNLVIERRMKVAKVFMMNLIGSMLI